MLKTNENKILFGEIIESLPNTMFKVALDEGREILAVPSGKMRRGFIRLLPGTKVKVEFTPYDSERGRIIGSLEK
jgi:translation initiation factor IF-1